LNGETHKLVGQQLIEAGLITESQLQDALKLQKDNGGFLGKVLIDMKLVSEEDLAEFLVKQCRVPHVILANMDIPEEAVRAVPKELAYRFRLIPIDKLGKVLSIAMVNPMDQDAVDIIKETTGLSVRPFICTNSDLDMKLREQYGSMEGMPGAEDYEPEESVEQVLDQTPEAEAAAPSEQKAEAEEVQGVEEEHGDGLLVPDYTFETFVVGNGNDFTHAIARAVAENPGGSHNPVYIHGACGLGKTHLLHAIGNEIKKRNAESRISYRSLEEFVSEMIEAIQMGKVDEFRDYYAGRNCLLLDDIQFLAGKERAQEEFVNTFEKIYEANRQIVITSDRPPKEIEALKENLRSRFEGGIITDIRAPDEETRQAILKSIARRYGVDVPGDVLGLIAGRIDTNVRELEGCLKKLIAFSSITDQSITMDLAKGVLKKFGKSVAEPPSQKEETPAAEKPRKAAKAKKRVEAEENIEQVQEESEAKKETRPKEKPVKRAKTSKQVKKAKEPEPEEVEAEEEEKPKEEPLAEKEKVFALRKQFGERLKAQLQKTKNQEDLEATLGTILKEAQKLFAKKGDKEFAEVLGEAAKMAESGEVKQAIVATAKACKG